MPVANGGYALPEIRVEGTEVALSWVDLENRVYTNILSSIFFIFGGRHSVINLKRKIGYFLW